MARLSIGSTPWGEDCVQTTDVNYEALANQECRAFAGQLKRHYEARNGKPVPCELKVCGQPHDFGTYYEVAAIYDENDEAQCEAAFWLEANTPESWDAEAAKALGIEQ